MAIEETITLNDKVSDAAIEAADATLQLDKALKSAADSAKIVGDAANNTVAEMKAADKAFNKAFSKAVSIKRKLQKQEAAAEAKAHKEKAAAAKESATEALAAKAAFVGAFAATAAAALAAVAAVAALTAKILKTAGAAVIARDGMRGALDQVTKGRGKEALKVLDKIAKGLNMPVDEVKAQFIALRKDGLNNIQSTKLIKLRADLIAVGVSAGDADKAIKDTAAQIKKGIDPDKAIKEAAKDFGAIGTGANASAASVHTLGGAMKKAQLIGSRLVGRVADAAKPAFDKAAASVSNWLSEFENSKAAKQIIKAIVTGINAVVEAGSAFIKELKPGLDAIGDAFEELDKALGSTTEGTNAAATAGSGFGKIVSFLAKGFALLIGAAAKVVSAFTAFAGAVKSVKDAVSGAIDAVKGGGKGMAAAGSEFVGGFVKGIADAAGAAIKAAASMAQGAVDAVKSKLGIASPSKVAAGLGTNFGDSYSEAVDESMPESVAMALPSNDNAGAIDAPIGGGGSGNTFNIELHFGGTSATATDIELAVQRGAEQAMRLAGVA